MLYIAVEEMPSAEYVEGDEVLRHVAQFDDDFFHQCDSELKKVNNFFAGNQLLLLLFLTRERVK